MCLEDAKGLGFVFYTKMLEHSDKTAQIDALTGEKDTYAQLLQRSVRTALKLQEKGIMSDHIVTICSLNYRDTCIPLLAAQFLGAVTSGLDPTLSLTDVIHLLKQVPPKIIFVISDAADLIRSALEEIGLEIEIVVFGQTKTHTPFSTFLEPNKSEGTFRPMEIDGKNKTAMVLFSSGTTGLSKGIRINHFRFLKNARLTMLAQKIGAKQAYDVNLSTTSLYWMTANSFLAISILNGFTRILLPVFDAENMCKAIEKYEPTSLFTTPVQLVELSNKKMELGANGNSLRHISTGGVSIFDTHVKIITSAFPNALLVVGYGQTETGMLSTFNVSDPEEIKLLQNDPTSCGKIFSEYSYKVVDIETRESLGPNKPGELLIKGEILFNGYYGMDSSQVWEDGWYKTGDIVYVTEHGCLHIVDRLKEMLKFQSWHVPPASIEQVLVTHPAVEKCIVIGIPHEMDGDHPMAIVVLKKSFEGTKPEEIKEFVEKQVDDRKKLRGGVKIVDKFPTQITGKIRRRVIKAMVLSGEL